MHFVTTTGAVPRAYAVRFAKSVLLWYNTNAIKRDNHDHSEARMKEKVEQVIKEKINPMLATHGGSCELIGVRSDNVVVVKLQGACGGCPSAMITLKGFVLEVLREHVPEVADVEAV
ncbi:MAG: NifU family protein [bacterium]|nr:NifU family protein [bacterium]